LRHPNQAAACESIEWSLAESAETSDGPAAPSNDDLASPLHSLQILAEAIVQLADPDFALRLM